jgi:hypothetical protein
MSMGASQILFRSNWVAYTNALLRFSVPFALKIRKVASEASQTPGSQAESVHIVFMMHVVDTLWQLGGKGRVVEGEAGGESRISSYALVRFLTDEPAK